MQNKTYKLFLYSITLLLFLTTSITPKIYETNNFSDVLKHVDSDTLVLLDIDNTLARPKGNCHIGSDPWFYDLLKEKKDINLALPDYCLGSVNIDLQPAEKNTVSVFNKLKKTCPTIGLTARNLYISSDTVLQLEKIDINFDGDNIPSQESVYYSHKDHPSTYHHGILFCGVNEKEAVIPFLLKQLKKRPKTIIFVDDKEKNLKTVEKIAEKEGLKFIGFRYGACDEYVKKYDAAQAKKDFEEIKNKRLHKKKR
ncbi:DUF2608 domain-containing protein [bacterium]|jgi:hypothetical protein|nr:DUF2608 domain-containing protein [bacterium]MBT5015488.1 DUF2608 domain-containing protein [bacterium]